MRRLTAAALAALLVLALTGCGEDNGGEGDGDGGVPWWVFWMATQNRTEVHYVPAPNPGPGYRVPPRNVPRAPAFKAPAYRAPVRTK